MRRSVPVIAMAFLLGACAQSATTVLPTYTLANGQVLQDVVTTAADPSGGAPVMTALTTYDVTVQGQTAMIGRESASSLGPGLILAGAFGSAAVIAAVDALDDNGGSLVQNSTYATIGNTATGGGDAGDIDAVTAAWDCREDCSVSN